MIVKTVNCTFLVHASIHIGEQGYTRKIDAKDIVDTLRNSLDTRLEKIDKHSRPSQQIIVRCVTVAANSETGGSYTCVPYWKRALRKCLNAK